MIRRANARPFLLASLFLSMLLIGGGVAAQQQSDVDAVKAANQAFYTALSGRDVAAMQKVWSGTPIFKTLARVIEHLRPDGIHSRRDLDACLTTFQS